MKHLDFTEAKKLYPVAEPLYIAEVLNSWPDETTEELFVWFESNYLISPLWVCRHLGERIPHSTIRAAFRHFAKEGLIEYTYGSDDEGFIRGSGWMLTYFGRAVYTVLYGSEPTLIPEI